MSTKFFVLVLSAFFLAAPSQAAVKDWTLLVFINGHSNLDPYGDSDINEMESAGRTTPSTLSFNVER
jgi:hypothetical protein